MKELLPEKTADRIKSKMEALCAKREYCTSDIVRKIEALKAKLDAPDVDAGEIVGKLQATGFLSDLRYSGAFAREKSQLSGWGEMKIRYALRAKRIPPEIVDEALAEIDGQKAEERLDKLLVSKAKTLKDDPQARFKLLKYALSRGYDYDTVEKRLRSLKLV